MFGVGYAVQAVLRLLRTLTKLFSRPRVLLEALTHADNFKLGAFLGVYVAVFKVPLSFILPTISQGFVMCFLALYIYFLLYTVLIAGVCQRLVLIFVIG